MNIDFYNQLQKELSETSQKARLIAVTKYSSAEEVNEAIKQGVTIIGENRLQVAEEKFKELEGFSRKAIQQSDSSLSLRERAGVRAEKHFIGTIQSKKLRKIIQLFDVIESVGSWDHLEKINTIAVEEGKKVRVFLQVNISSEMQKSGFKPSELEGVEQKISSFRNVQIEGLMGMAENTRDELDIRMQFRLAKNIFENLKGVILSMKELSLGMSHDYKIALEEGATLIRIGSKLFK